MVLVSFLSVDGASPLAVGARHAIKDQINLYANQGYKLHTIISDENVGYTIIMEKEKVLDE